MKDPEVKQRKVLSGDLARAAKGIIKRLNKELVCQAILVKGKKEHALQYLLDGTLPEKISEVQLCTVLYYGGKLTYGPKGSRVDINTPSYEEEIKTVAALVPEEELTKVSTGSRSKTASAKDIAIKLVEEMVDKNGEAIAKQVATSLPTITSHLSSEEIESIIADRVYKNTQQQEEEPKDNFGTENNVNDWM